MCNKCNTPKCSCDLYCKTTLLAQCVKNFNQLNILNGDNRTVLQTLLVSINNLLESISSMDCVTYTRTIDEDTKIASYTHSLNWECMASEVCEECDNPCICPPPSNLTVSFDGTGFSSPDMYRVLLSWVGTPEATSYRVEYKKSEDSEWMLAAPTVSISEYNGIIIDTEGADYYSYDFRVRANCDGCNSSFITNSYEVISCEAPTNLVWHQDDLKLTFNAQPGLTFSDFELAYKAYSDPSYTIITVPITETSPGSYSANLALTPLTFNTLYTYRLRRKCTPSIFSDNASGCASICSVSLQLNPVLTLNVDNTITASWGTISGIYGYDISIYNVTDSSLVYETSVGSVSGYTTTVLTAGKNYKITVTPKCSTLINDCEGRSSTIEIPTDPDFNYYTAEVYTCEDWGCELSETTTVYVPFPSTLTIGYFYNDSLGSGKIYKILSVASAGSGVPIDISTGEDTCVEFCPPSYTYYMAKMYYCLDGECIFHDEQRVRVPTPYTLTPGMFYKDVDLLGVIFEILSLTTPGPVTYTIDPLTESDTCRLNCTFSYYKAVRYDCTKQCVPDGDFIVRAFSGLMPGKFYINMDNTAVYLIVEPYSESPFHDEVHPYYSYNMCGEACIHL